MWIDRHSEFGSSDSHNDYIHVAVDYPVIMGFEPLVNQRLLPPTFPRYTRLRTRKEAMHYLEEMVARLRHITKITHCTTFHSALVGTCSLGLFSSLYRRLTKFKLSRGGWWSSLIRFRKFSHCSFSAIDQKEAKKSIFRSTWVTLMSIQQCHVLSCTYVLKVYM